MNMPRLGPGMKPLFAEQKSVSPAKTQGLAVGLGGMFFGLDRVALADVAHGDSGVGDVRAFGQARGFDRGAAGRVAEFEAGGVELVHHAVRDFVGEVRIDEDHVGEREASGFVHGFEAVEREIDLRGRIRRDFSGGGVDAWHVGDEETVVREHAPRESFVRFVIRRRDGFFAGEIADGHRGDLDRRIRIRSDAEDSARRRIFREVGGEGLVEVVVFGRVVHVDLDVDDVVHREAGGGNEGLDVVEALLHLVGEAGRRAAVGAVRALAGDVDVIAGVDRLGAEGVGLWRGPGST